MKSISQYPHYQRLKANADRDEASLVEAKEKFARGEINADVLRGYVDDADKTQRSLQFAFTSDYYAWSENRELQIFSVEGFDPIVEGDTPTGGRVAVIGVRSAARHFAESICRRDLGGQFFVDSTYFCHWDSPNGRIKIQAEVKRTVPLDLEYVQWSFRSFLRSIFHPREDANTKQIEFWMTAR